MTLHLRTETNGMFTLHLTKETNGMFMGKGIINDVNVAKN